MNGLRRIAPRRRGQKRVARRIRAPSPAYRPRSTRTKHDLKSSTRRPTSCTKQVEFARAQVGFGDDPVPEGQRGQVQRFRDLLDGEVQLVVTERRAGRNAGAKLRPAGHPAASHAGAAPKRRTSSSSQFKALRRAGRRSGREGSSKAKIEDLSGASIAGYTGQLDTLDNGQSSRRRRLTWHRASFGVVRRTSFAPSSSAPTSGSPRMRRRSAKSRRQDLRPARAHASAGRRCLASTTSDRASARRATPRRRTEGSARRCEPDTSEWNE